MDAFNYYLTCRSPSCQEGKNFKVALNKYTDDGSCFLTEKEKKGVFVYLYKVLHNQLRKLECNSQQRNYKINEKWYNNKVW